MDWHLIAAVLAVLITLYSAVLYIKEMLRGTTRPNIVSWSLWVLIQGIFAAAQFSAGASLSIVLPLIEVLTVGVIVVLGLFGYGYKKYGPLDFICLALALCAIAGWQLTSDPMIALWLSVGADILAAVPTFIKAYRDPKSETPFPYFLVAFSAIAAAFATNVIDVPNLLWPANIFFGNTLIVSLILLGRRNKK